MKMAGVVASTLRRRTYRQKHSADAKYQFIEPGHIALSPGGSRPPSRSPSFTRQPVDKAESDKSTPTPGPRLPEATKLEFVDFWPECTNPMEQCIRLSQFETFDTLIPKANTWLQEHIDISLVKCETVEKKVTSIHEVTSDNPMFTPMGESAIYVKGLRLWYIEDEALLVKGADTPTATEIGYMNVIPKCLDSAGKYPLYENLPETYAAINDYLSQNPMEGKILTIETVPLKLPRRNWQGPEVDPDKTYFLDEYLRHVLYITRIYFIYGLPEEELIGAQDFLPDFVAAPSWYSIYGIYPKYRLLVTAMHKLKDWLHSARNIRVTNIQTLEAVYRKHPENVHTGVNFVDKVESCAMIRFVRVTYVRPKDDSIQCLSMYSPPTGFSYKTFVPAAMKVGMCSGSPEYEPLGTTWQRAKAWFKYTDRRVISVETSYHTLGKIWHDQDQGESTVMNGEWSQTNRREVPRTTRRVLVQVTRVYMDGDYSEPPPQCLPPIPPVEEFNDCGCTIL